jgi:hypothetical protein
MHQIFNAIKYIKPSTMKSLLALFGWKYVKNIRDGKFHHYKCHELKGIQNRKTYNEISMDKDIS